MKMIKRVAKPLSSLALLFLLSIISLSCDESFDPKAGIKEQYLLFSIIRGDSLAQMAVLAKTYNVEGYRPEINTISPELSGAVVTLSYDTSPNIMLDSLVPRTDTSRYKDYQRIYYYKGKAPQIAQNLSIKAVLPDGKTITAKAKVPPRLYLKKSAYSIGTVSERSATTSFTIGWQTTGGYLFSSRLRIVYKKDGVVETLYKDVPMEYVYVNKVPTPIYPGVGRQQGLAFSYPAIDSAMAQVAGDDYNKGAYRILSAKFELLVLDENLSKYYSSTNGYLDEFSVRLDENVFTNLSGGLGVFGAYMKTEETILFDFDDYVKSFGYRR